MRPGSQAASPALPAAAPGRGDLVRALVAGGRLALAETAELLGFERRPELEAQLRLEARPQRGQRLPAAEGVAPVAELPKPTDPATQQPELVSFWRPLARERREDDEDHSPESAQRPVERLLRPEDLVPGAKRVFRSQARSSTGRGCGAFSTTACGPQCRGVRSTYGAW